MGKVYMLYDSNDMTFWRQLPGAGQGERRVGEDRRFLGQWKHHV